MGQNLYKTGKLQPRLSEREWGTLEWRVDDSLAAGTGMSVAVMTLQKGKASPPHRHPNSHEFIYVAKGRVEITLDGKKVVLREGDSLLAPSGTAHRLRNAGEEDAQMVLSYSAGRRIYEEI